MREETKRKISEANKGKVRTPEMREQNRLRKLANPTRYWLGKKLTPEHKKKLSNAKLGKSPWNLGKKLSPEHLAKISGENASNWQGGISTENEIMRKRKEYRAWREAVFARDNWECQECHDRSGNGHTVILNADHIKPFSTHPELRFDIDNGRTLCVSCHRKTDTYGSKLFNRKKSQLV